MSSFVDKKVLVTGGANGIGRLLGIQSLQEGAKCLVVWDIDEKAMAGLQKQCKENGWKCLIYKVDLTNIDEIENAAQKVQQHIGMVDILFNNAGIAVGKKFKDHSRQDIHNTLSINVEAVMSTTRAFLPAMLKQGSGHIVNISSASAHIGNPNMSVYAASKWAISGWSESLRLELQQAGNGIKVTTVEPSYINTGMFAGVKAPVLTPLLDPDAIVEKIIRAVKKNKIVLREPLMVKLTPFLKGILPARIFDFMAGKLFNVYSSMDTFRGRAADE